MDRRQLLTLAAVGPATAATAPFIGRGSSSTAAASSREVMPGESIQAALDAGPGHVICAPGTHTLSSPIVLRSHRWLSGAFGATTLRPGSAMSALLVVGNAGPVDRWKISDLTIDATGAATGIDINIIGTAGNTHGEPDSQGRIEDVFISDPSQQGIWYRGTDAQAIITRGVRVRRAGIYAYRIENADSWWSNCEGTTTTSQGAGFYVTGSNLHFDHCGAWYCRGYGWHIRGVRNTFTGCAAQDTGGHGWRVAYEQNTLAACIADTASMYDVGGTPSGADGFYIDPATNITLTGCLAYDRRPNGHASQQRYGFSAPRAMFDAGLLLGCTGWDNAAGLYNKR